MTRELVSNKVILKSAKKNLLSTPISSHVPTVATLVRSAAERRLPRGEAAVAICELAAVARG